MILVENVSKYYGAHRAVNGLNFTINKGECIGFLGLNGAGKSTTLRMLSCLLLPTSGRISIDGLDVESNPHEIRKRIGYLPDTPPVYLEMTVREYLIFAGKLREMGSADLEKRLPEVLNICSLVEVADQAISSLSHGYRQRVGIAQAIIHNPALLILDEPIQGLDPVQIVEMRAMIRSLRGQHTILLSTHILSEIEQTCDRILMLHEGHIAAEGTEDELIKRYRSGGDVELEVRGDESKVKEIVKGISGVSHVEVAKVDGGHVWLRVRSAGEIREELAKALVQNGMGVLGLKQVAGGLEKIFVELNQHHESTQQAKN